MGKGFLSNTKKIKNIGSGHGYSHWKMQRISAIGLFFLYLWFIYMICIFFTKPHHAITSILYSPFSMIMFIITIALSIYHGCLGMRVVCEDYISNYAWRFSVLILVYFISIITVCFAVFMLVANFIINI